MLCDRFSRGWPPPSPSRCSHGRVSLSSCPDEESGPMSIVSSDADDADDSQPMPIITGETGVKGGRNESSTQTKTSPSTWERDRHFISRRLSAGRLPKRVATASALARSRASGTRSSPLRSSHPSAGVVDGWLLDPFDGERREHLFRHLRAAVCDGAVCTKAEPRAWPGL